MYPTDVARSGSKWLKCCQGNTLRLLTVLAVALVAVLTSACSSTAATACPTAIAHAGAGHAAGAEPLAGFTEAAGLHAPVVELDVRFSSNGIGMVAHDASVGGFVIAHHTAGWWNRRGVSTLGQVLTTTQRTDPHVSVVAELKTYPTTSQLAYYVAKIGTHHLQSRWTVESFDPRTLALVQAKYPALSTALISSTYVYPETVRESGTGFIVSQDVVTPLYVEQLHAAGVTDVMAWTVNTGDGFARMTLAGVDGVMTDRLAMFQSFCAGL